MTGHLLCQVFPCRPGHRCRRRELAAILANPRYTGRQVRRRQSIDRHELRPGDKSSRPKGYKPTPGRSPPDQWVI
jgi:site-specific DNA recombinase